MRKLLCACILLIASMAAQAQGPVNLVDTLKKKLSKAKTPSERVDILGNLARMASNNSVAEADVWGQKMTEEAELSRDRKLIIKALLVNGERYSYLSAKREYLDKSLGYFQQALAEARREKRDTEITAAHIWLANIYLNIPDYEKAMSNATQAMSNASLLESDSIKAEALAANGAVYQARKERLMALRFYLNAQRLAEGLKNHKLMRACYVRLSSFYSGIGEFDKSIDFAQRALDELMAGHDGGEQYNRVIDLTNIGYLYVQKKSWDMAQSFFERSLRLADSLRYPPMKIPGYNGLLNLYIQNHQPQKALAFFNKQTELREFAGRFGLGYVIDMAYGVIYTDMNRFDSAQYYFEKAAPMYENAATPQARIQFYNAWGELHKRSGLTAQAIALFEKARTLSDGVGNLELQKDIATELDSLYAKAGDFRQSNYFKGLTVAYKDSLQKLGEEKDLLQVELADEAAREKRRLAEEAAAEERKHTLQYTFITMAIAAVFVLLVGLGLFQVSPGVIKVLGFFSFIFLFEFIILIADNKIHHWTHGEPLKVLGIKVLLIAALLPLHHWLEHKVVHYIASRKLNEHAGRVGIARFLRRKKEPQDS